MNALRGPAPVLLALSLSLAVGCDEDDAGGVAAGAGAGGAGSGLSGSGGSGLAGTGGGLAGASGLAGGSGATACPPLPPKSGAIAGSFEDAAGAAHDVSLPEIGCRTLHRRDGSVVGYQASFGAFTPGTSIDGQYAKLPAVRLRIGATFRGDGSYENERVYVRAADGANLDGPVTVVLSDGGKRGKITLQSTGSVLDYTCDPSDATDTSTSPALTESPGRLVVEDGTGIAAAFDNLSCPSIGTLVLAPARPSYCTPSEYFLTPKIGTNTSMPGTVDLDGGSYAYLDGIALGRVNTGPNATLTVASASPNRARSRCSRRAVSTSR